MNKKQILALTGAACMSVALLAGCGNNGNNETPFPAKRAAMRPR